MAGWQVDRLAVPQATRARPKHRSCSITQQGGAQGQQQHAGHMAAKQQPLRCLNRRPLQALIASIRARVMPHTELGELPLSGDGVMG